MIIYLLLVAPLFSDISPQFLLLFTFRFFVALAHSRK